MPSAWNILITICYFVHVFHLGIVQGVRPPVVLINGIMGSKLYVNESKVQYPQTLNCEPSTEKNRKIWISRGIYTPLGNSQACEFFRMTPTFDSKTQMFQDQLGVNITSGQFGDLEPLRCLISDSGKLCAWAPKSVDSAYYNRFIEYLKTVFHYEASVNLIGAAYDWRYPPEMQEMFYGELKKEIEKLVTSTGMKVVIVAHSMGNKVLNFFLSRHTNAAWREKFINKTINVAPAFGGSVGTMKELAIGFKVLYGIVLTSDVTRDFARSLPSISSLLPSPAAFNNSRTLFKVGNNTFTSTNMEQFLKFINSPDLLLHFGQSEEVPIPDVPMVVVLGNVTQSTPSSYTFAKSLKDEPVIVYADGDNRIETAVITDLCQRWRENGTQIDIKQLPQTHTQLITSREFFSIFGNTVIKQLPAGETYPALENIMIQSDRNVCFSSKPFATCDRGTVPKSNRGAEVAKFVCFDNSDPLANDLMKQSANDQTFDLSEYNVSFSKSVIVANTCVNLDL